METLGSIFTDTSRLHHRYHHRIFESFNLHRGQSRLFDKLEQSDGISQRELAQRMNIAPATLTRMVQNMEKNGYVSRQTDPQDQRITRIHLTAKGIETRKRIRKKMRAVDRKIFKHFSQAEKEHLEEMLMRIQKELELELACENHH
ncbi:MarR family transcriptional regulator [Kiritimatiellota bacterium B12222]|nr:MarR family transcriptional regulator [Kiritimatiellota bacterium B12222]